LKILSKTGHFDNCNCYNNVIIIVIIMGKIVIIMTRIFLKVDY